MTDATVPHAPTREPDPGAEVSRTPRPVLSATAKALLGLVLFGLVAVIAGVWFLNAVEASIRNQDDNLLGMMKAYVAGLADELRPPANPGVSEGAQFWISLFTTDGAAEPSDVYLEPGDAGFLICPRDPVMREDTVIEAIRDARDPAVFIDGKTVCSYNGPTLAAMRDTRTLADKIIGCTGDRSGVPMRGDGSVHVIWGSLKAERISWDDAARLGNTAVLRQPTAATFLVPMGHPFALDGQHVVD